MKRSKLPAIIAIICVLTLLLSLAACGSSSETVTKEDQQASGENAQDNAQDDAQDSAQDDSRDNGQSDSAENEDGDASSKENTGEADKTTATEATTESTKEATTESATESATESSPEESTEPTPEPFKETVHVKVGASSYDEISLKTWENLVEPLKEQNIELEVAAVEPVEGTPFYQVMEDEQVDFYNWRADRWFVDGKLAEEMADDTYWPVWYTYALPYNFYSSKYASLDELPEGAEICVPNTYLDHALKILESAGVLKLKENMPEFDAYGSALEENQQAFVKENVTENPKQLKITCYDVYFMQQFAFNPEKEYDAIILTDYFGRQYGDHYPKSRMIYEDPLTDEDYIPVMLGRRDSINDPQKLEVIKRVRDAWQSQITLDYFNKINLANKPAGWDIDLLERYK